MSQDPNNKPDDLENDSNPSQINDDFGDFDFSSYTEESEFGDTNPVDFDFPSHDAAESAPTPSDPFSAEESVAPLDDDLGLPPFGDSGASETPTDQAGAAAPELEEAEDPKKKKKEKKEKKEKPAKAKKEPSGKAPLELGTILGVIFSVLLLFALIGFNIYCIIASPFKDVGFMSTLYYLIVVDIVGLFAVSVPFLLGRNPKSIDLFQAAVGVSVMAMSLGVILLMTCIVRYDMTVSAPKSLPAGLNLPVEAPEAAPSEG